MRTSRDPIQSLVARWFRQRVDTAGTRRGLPRYYAVIEGERPVWWSEQSLPRMETLGVYEANPSSSEGAIVFTPEELVVLGAAAVRVRYDALQALGKLSKEPVSLSIEATLSNGETLSIPVAGQTGAAFTIQSFLLGAMAAFRPALVVEDVSTRECPHCRVVSTRFRISEEALICPACGRSFAA